MWVICVCDMAYRRQRARDSISLSLCHRNTHKHDSHAHIRTYDEKNSNNNSTQSHFLPFLFFRSLSLALFISCITVLSTRTHWQSLKSMWQLDVSIHLLSEQRWNDYYIEHIFEWWSMWWRVFPIFMWKNTPESILHWFQWIYFSFSFGW